MVTRVLTAPDSKTLRADQQGVTLNQPTIPGFSSGGGSESYGTSFTGIDNPDALKMLLSTLQQLYTGGSPETKKQLAERNAQIGSARGTLADYTKGSAFTDAAALMAQQLRLAMEKNMPAINKGIQNAGTSGSSMAALLSQKLATESSQAAAALGAEQAKAYGGISAQLQSVLEALTRVDRGGEENLIKALEATKVQRGSETSTKQPTYEQTASGGGQLFQSFDSLRSVDSGINGGGSQYQDGVWYGPNKVNSNGSYVPLGTKESFYDASGYYIG